MLECVSDFTTTTWDNEEASDFIATTATITTTTATSTKATIADSKDQTTAAKEQTSHTTDISHVFQRHTRKRHTGSAITRAQQQKIHTSPLAFLFLPAADSLLDSIVGQSPSLLAFLTPSSPSSSLFFSGACCRFIGSRLPQVSSTDSHATSSSAYPASTSLRFASNSKSRYPAGYSSSPVNSIDTPTVPPPALHCHGRSIEPNLQQKSVSASASRTFPVLSPTTPSSRFGGRSRPLAARLWNPTNSTPRLPKHANTSTLSPCSSPRGPASPRKHRTSTPSPPSVPFSHPEIERQNASGTPDNSLLADPPLLTLPEQRQSKNSNSANHAAFNLDFDTGRRVSLPRSVRLSYEERRSSVASAHQRPSPVAAPSSPEPFPVSLSSHQESSSRPLSGVSQTSPDTCLPQPPPPVVTPPSPHLRQNATIPKISVTPTMATTTATMSHPSQAATTSTPAQFSRDLERGPDSLAPPNFRVSLGSVGSGLSSSDSSMMGEDVDGIDGEEWGPQHPCYPHRNPYVPVDSPEYSGTRIIRVRRDFLVSGDVTPAFADLYPEILDPAGMSEAEFRRVVERVNKHLQETFDPYSARNVVDGVLGLVTGWIWEDLGMTNVKQRLKSIEAWLENWNREMERSMGAEGRSMAPKIIPLRLSGYMSLDIQIPDPEIAPAQNSPTTPGSAMSRIAPFTPQAATTGVA
ncbi:Ras modification protein ERF4 [Ceratocystis lukuohia]|uniref:Ras modification protein ERF4 n=1 Tax=Ceratocystis lukuohia TaxID=2019550 RepID=A0ABR4MG35_9PEZI